VGLQRLVAAVGDGEVAFVDCLGDVRRCGVAKSYFVKGSFIHLIWKDDRSAIRWASVIDPYVTAIHGGTVARKALLYLDARALMSFAGFVSVEIPPEIGVYFRVAGFVEPET
jgi:hypothetical protein